MGKARVFIESKNWPSRRPANKWLIARSLPAGVTWAWPGSWRVGRVQRRWDMTLEIAEEPALHHRAVPPGAARTASQNSARSMIIGSFFAAATHSRISGMDQTRST